MKDNALSVANYFVELAKNEGKDIRPLKLMKLVYIAYGYALAMFEKPIIDYRFDKVEAWKLGPVIPSVYHSFKMYGKNPITEKTTVFETNGRDVDVVTPELHNQQAKDVCGFVWRHYGLGYTDNELVKILHGPGTPWGKVYEEGKNNIIPESLTWLYYKNLIDTMREMKKRDEEWARK